MSVSAGQRLGPHQVVARLGAGGMGEVYRARDPRLERTVAIKIPPPQLAESDAYRQRFQREARAASALSHPNIAHVYDVGEQDGIHFIAMEYVEGENLRFLDRVRLRQVRSRGSRPGMPASHGGAGAASVRGSDLGGHRLRRPG